MLLVSSAVAVVFCNVPLSMSGPIAPSDWAYSAKASGGYPYDPRAAAAALDRAGWSLDPDVRPPHT